MGESPTSVGRESKTKSGKEAYPNLWYSRFAKRKNHLCERRKRNRWGKKTKGRKRHIAVDTMGNLLAVVVHAANIHDTKAGIFPALRACDTYPSIEKFSGDEGYRKTFEEDVAEFLGMSVDISERIAPKFEILPKRWVVERTFAWMGHSRRLAKDYEIRIDSAENMVMISHIHTLLKRLA